MENIDKNSVFWNHMSDEEKKLLLESTRNAGNIEDTEDTEENESDVDDSTGKKYKISTIFRLL